MMWSPQKQLILLLAQENACLRQHKTTPIPNDHCPATWDRIICWPETEPDTMSMQQCPDYVYGVNTHGIAWIYCTNNGTWRTQPGSDRPWSNFSECLVENNTYADTGAIPDIIKNRIGEIQLTYTIGYGLSLVSLTIAVFIMTYIKQLRSLRNMIHVNLFVSFIIRAVLSYLKDILLVSHLGFPSDVRIGEDGQTEFIVEGSHVACRALFSLFNYILQTNFVWLLLEGVHVHIVLFFPRFSVKIKLLWFMIMGWCFPSLYVIAWAISRLQQDNTLCWNVNILSNLYWFLKAPIIASIAINFILFLNMVRLLYTKVSAMSISDSRKSRKLGRGTLILIPLYGVYNVVFILIPEDQLDEYGQFITLFIEMFVNSFQGFLIAIVFCFRNQQVRSEVYRLWQRFLLNRSDLGPVDRSRTWSTLSHIPRPRIGSQSSNTSDKSKHPSAVNKAAEKNSRQITPQGNEDNTEQSNLLSRTLSTVHERVEPKQFFVKPPSENYDMETERVIPVSQSNV